MPYEEKKELTEAEIEWLKAGLARSHKERIIFALDLYKKKMTKNGFLLKPWMIR